MLERAMPTRNSKPFRPSARRSSYRPPTSFRSVPISDVLKGSGRAEIEPKQLSLLRSSEDSAGDEVLVHMAGDLSLLDRPCVAIVGSRSASEVGLGNAARLARVLVNNGFVVVSGLAAGIDAAAHAAAIEAGGSTIAVIGTPLNKAYPIDNAAMQEIIYRDHLLVSPFREGEKTFKSSFPKRNRVMAAITDATVIIEASDTSGTLHQAAECARLGRWLFVAQSLANNEDLDWPKRFLGKPKTGILSIASDVIDTILEERERCYAGALSNKLHKGEQS